MEAKRNGFIKEFDTQASWGAFAIAILFECPVTPEEAIELYYHGSIVIGGSRRKAETIVKSCRIARLRLRGLAWWAISELTGITSPESYIGHRHGLVEAIERRKTLFLPIQEEAVVCGKI